MTDNLFTLVCSLIVALVFIFRVCENEFKQAVLFSAAVMFLVVFLWG